MDIDLCGPSMPRILGVENEKVYSQILFFILINFITISDSIDIKYFYNF